ncbi:MAG: putative DCC family thiol-disulfide oxidoreductase YuxK [Planctomycetota bacterium]|jgi:predicted DCC family thiol-disulfide oxidoreductase YuxK
MPSTRRHVVYDGDCFFCRAGVRLLVAVGYTRAADARPFAFYDPDTAARLMRAGIHNELAVLDPGTKEVRSGAVGLLWKLEEGPLWPLAKLLSLPGPKHVCTAAYRLVSFNRRIIAPLPAGQIACACDPDMSFLWRGAFVALGLGVAAALALPYAGMLAAGSAVGVALLAGAGLATVLAAAVPDGLEAILERAGVLAWIVFLSSLWLVPFRFWAEHASDGAASWILAAGAVVCLGNLARIAVQRFGLERRYMDPALKVPASESVK